MSNQTFSYGTYSFVFRASSTASTPYGQGTAVEGSLSFVQLYVDSTHSITLFVEGTAGRNARNLANLSVQSGSSTAVQVPCPNPESCFQSVKFTWSSGRLQVKLNGQSVQIFTTNVPSASLKILFGHYGTNDSTNGGLATAATPRYMYVSQVLYLPPANTQFFSFALQETLTIQTTLVPVTAAAITRAFSFALTETSSQNFIVATTVYVPPPTLRDFAFALSETRGGTVALGVSTAVARSFSFALSETSVMTAAIFRTGGGVSTTTGWLNPSAVQATGWTNTQNLFASDDARMTYTAAANATTPEFFAYSFNGLSIPEGSSIQGIAVHVEGLVTAGSVVSTYFRLVHTTSFQPTSATEKTLTLNTGSSSSTDTGWIAATAQSSTVGWTNAANMIVQDGSDATVAITAAETPYLRVTGFTGLSSIPSTASITGIQFQFKGRNTVAADYSYFEIGDVLDGTPMSINQNLVILPVSSTTNSWVSTGGATDLWGGLPAGATFTPAVVQASNFGIAGAWGVTPATTFNLDGVQCKVFYTTAGGTETAQTIGGSTDAWGGVDINGDSVADRVWDYTDFTPTLAFWGGFTAGSSGATIALDNVQLNVYYTTPTVNDNLGVAADTGWVSPTINYNTTGWANSSNMYVTNGAVATTSVTAAETPYIRVAGFPLTSMPSDATIDGFEVKMNGHSSAAIDSSYFFVGNVNAGTPQSIVNYPCPLPTTTSADVLLGGAADVWGGADTPAAWTRADVINSDFGVSGAWSTTPANTFSLDGVSMKVHYHTGGSTPPPPPPPPPPGPPPPPPPPGIIALPAKVLAAYVSGYGNTLITSVPTTYNQIYLFQADTDGGAAWVGTGAYTMAYNSAFSAARIATCRARGQRVVLTIGGSGANFFFQNRTQSTNCLNSIVSMIGTFGQIDGLDFNNFEQFSIQYPGTTNANTLATEMIWISQQLKTRYGTNFSISAAPSPGAGYAPSDRIVMSAMAAAGVLDYAAPQFYDDSGYASTATCTTILNQWISLLGASKVMFGSGANYTPSVSLTVTQAVSVYNTAKAANPTIRGAFGWEAQTDAAAGTPWSFGTQMRAVL